MGAAIASTLGATDALVGLFEEPKPDAMFITPTVRGRTAVIPTASVVLEQPTKKAVRMLRSRGLKHVKDGREARQMFVVPGEADEAVVRAADISREIVESGEATACYPNFIRVLQRPQVGAPLASTQWNLDNEGDVGLPGADVHAIAAWTITRGKPEVVVAVLDEGVDTRHRMLKDAVVAEADFFDDKKADAMPEGDDAHGTACTGIIASRDDKVRGLAPGVSIAACRIARGDGQGYWIFDDFQTGEAIAWCWREAGAHVLSNSWGGGAPSDSIINAVGRARRQGREGKGCVVVFAAGNTQQAIGFPGNLDGILTVGASNQWDQRKTKNSKDGENFWGSNHGRELDLVAPGVGIVTTDIAGRRGYSGGLSIRNFNGTSAATPHVAACAALILSIRPDLTESQVRSIIVNSADPIGAGTIPNERVGRGRLNCYAALWAARRA
jgi:thermitase